jgi:hypothetical protein
MIIEDGRDSGRNACAVIPTMDTGSRRVQSLIDELDSYGMDSILVQDRLPSFRFSRSVNAGIREVMIRKNVRVIAIVNDDISQIQGLDEMIQACTEGKWRNTYCVPHLNGERPLVKITTSRLNFVLHLTITRRAPFHGMRVMSGFGWVRHRKHFALGAPALPWDRHATVLNPQPFAVFPRSILERFVFDENFTNGLEDNEFGYRLYREGIKGLTSEKWQVKHIGGASFREARGNKKEKVGLYLTTDEEMIAAAEYFYSKHFSKSRNMKKV